MKTVSFQDNNATRLMRNAVIAVAVVLAFIVISCSTVKRIEAGHVGIRVKLAGSSRGVQDIPVVTGWVFYNPLSEQVVEFPTSVQNIVWTKSAHEGRPLDESIGFSSSEGLDISADIGMSFHIDPALAPHLFVKFKDNDLLRLADTYVRNAVRVAFSEKASKMLVHDIYGEGKGKLVEDVTTSLRDKLGPDGFLIDQLSIINSLRLPDNVVTSINRGIEATQNAIQAENRVRQVKAEADQAIAAATGEAEAARTRARGEADALLIRARGEAKANQIIRYSTTGSVLQYRALEKWNGKLPMMNGAGQLPMLTFDITKGGAGDDAEKKLRSLLEEDDAADKASQEEKKKPSAPAAGPPSPVAPAPASPLDKPK